MNETKICLKCGKEHSEKTKWCKECRDRGKLYSKRYYEKKAKNPSEIGKQTPKALDSKHQIKFVNDYIEHPSRPIRDKPLFRNIINQIKQRGNLPIFVVIGADSHRALDKSGKERKRELHVIKECYNDLEIQNGEDLMIAFDGDLEKLNAWEKEEGIYTLLGNWFSRYDLRQIPSRIRILEKKYGKRAELILFADVFGNRNDIEAYPMFLEELQPKFFFCLAIPRPKGKENTIKFVSELCKGYAFQSIPEMTFSGKEDCGNGIYQYGNPITQINLVKLE